MRKARKNEGEGAHFRGFDFSPRVPWTLATSLKATLTIGVWEDLRYGFQNGTLVIDLEVSRAEREVQGERVRPHPLVCFLLLVR